MGGRGGGVGTKNEHAHRSQMAPLLPSQLRSAEGSTRTVMYFRIRLFRCQQKAKSDNNSTTVRSSKACLYSNATAN